MSINDLHREYPNKNPELRAVSRQCYEYGLTVAQSPSANHSSALDEHDLRRQRQYVDQARDMIQALYDKPRPDRPISHNLQKPIDLSVEYKYWVEDLEGNEVALNEYTSLLAENWLMLAAGMAKSQSASLAGSMEEFDYNRAMTNLDELSQLLDEMEKRPSMDLPETALPEAELKETTGGRSRTKAK